MINEAKGVWNLYISLKQNFLGYVIISIFVLITISVMWDFSVDFSELRSLLHGTHFNAAKWLSENLKEGQTALIPSFHVLWSYDASLKNSTKYYGDVWKLSGIILQANITEGEIIEARNHLREYIKSDQHLKYIVIDWVDGYGMKYFSPRNCNKFDESLQEVERFVHIFPTENNGTWPGGVIICEKITNPVS